MPLYEYQCDACGHRFEAIRKFSDLPVARCPKCGGKVRKLQSAPAFHLKGTGWYATDYAKKDDSTAKKDDSTATKSEGERKDAPSEKKDGTGEAKDGSGKAKEAAGKPDKAAAKSDKSEKSEKGAASSDTPKPKAC